MQRWWLCWEQPLDESRGDRPRRKPPTTVVDWWNTRRSAASRVILCAIVDEATDLDAKDTIARAWPDHGRWRFCESKPIGWAPGDEFPWPKEDE